MIFESFLYSPEEMQKKRHLRASRALRNAKPFDQLPAKANHRYDLGCIASSYKPHNPLEGLLPTPGRGIDKAVRYKNLRYAHMSLPSVYGLIIGQANDLWGQEPKLFFDAEVPIASLHFKKESGQWDTWMSLTPFEFWTQASGIRAATGHVVLGGLGMGWLLSQIVQKPTVKAITVVENDQDLLDWFGYKLCEKLGVHVVHGDFWEHAATYDVERTRFIADIWPEYGQAERDDNLIALRATGAKVWAWGSARPSNWQKHRIERVRQGVKTLVSSSKQERYDFAQRGDDLLANIFEGGG